MNFEQEAATSNNPKWEKMISRQKELYSRGNDIRSEFQRDYTRIIHSTAYRRLKHKTQVFFSPENDHICTRIEHINYVESISYTLATYFHLNTELTKAIAVGHDLGHSPFGHQGEKVLSNISQEYIGEKFWHEKNGLDFVDKIELLEDDKKNKKNLNLTYAVRDGIISHCGEINENALKPRNEFINLNSYNTPNQFAPYTWEACVVKIADKISYIGRDIEDAITLGILDDKLDTLYKILQFTVPDKRLNNTFIINSLVYDLCQYSSPERGLCFSNEAIEFMDKIKEFNYKNIYFSDRLKPSTKYFQLVLTEIFETLAKFYDGKNTIKKLKNSKSFYPNLVDSFSDWLNTYWNTGKNDNLENDVIFNIENKKDYYKGIIYYISGMTDNFAIDIYNEIIGF